MRLHPRLQLIVHVAREGVGSHATRSAILGEFFFTIKSASFGSRTLPRDVANSKQNLEPQQYFDRTNSD